MKWVLAPIIATCAGCGMLSGLDALHTGDAGAVDASTTDAPADVALTCASGACGTPTGFEPVLFAVDRSKECPTTTTALDVVVDPSTNGASCICACDLSAQAMCLPTTFNPMFGDTCGGAGTPITADGGCTQGPGTNSPTHGSLAPFAPTCVSAPKTNGTASSAQGRLCALSDCTACNAPQGFALCWSMTGDVACPQSTTKHIVGGSAKIACSPCIDCKAGGTCRGTLQIFDANQCLSSNSAKLAVDGTCQAIAVPTMGAFQYAPTVDQPTCTPGSSTASVQVDQPTTICCP